MECETGPVSCAIRDLAIALDPTGLDWFSAIAPTIVGLAAVVVAVASWRVSLKSTAIAEDASELSRRATEATERAAHAQETGNRLVELANDRARSAGDIEFVTFLRKYIAAQFITKLPYAKSKNPVLAAQSHSEALRTLDVAENSDVIRYNLDAEYNTIMNLAAFIVSRVVLLEDIQSIDLHMKDLHAWIQVWPVEKEKAKEMLSAQWKSLSTQEQSSDT